MEFMSSLQNAFDDHKPSLFGAIEMSPKVAKASANDFQNYSPNNNYPASFPHRYATCLP